VEPNDEVIVPTITFIATVNAIHYNGARPVFMDVDSIGNIDAEKTIEFIEQETVYRDGCSHNKVSNRKISAIILVHVFGNAANLDKLLPLCEERNIQVLEDAAESLGTWYTDGNYAGRHTGTLGQVGCLSFNGNKIITAAGGGMILTDNSAMADRARYLITQAKDDRIYYRHDEVGYNYRLTNIQAAIGLAQFEQLPMFLEKKRENYESYKGALDYVDDYEIAPVPAYAQNNHWLTILRIKKDMARKNVGTVLDLFQEKNIEARPIWLPNHLQKPYISAQGYRIEQAEKIVRRSVCLPSGFNLTKENVTRVVSCLAD